MKWRNISEIFPDLRKRPGMFIGSESIFDLQVFLSGYEFALNVHEVEENNWVDEDLSFHDWVALRTHFYESTSGWANMLADRYGKEKALEYFWMHYDEYQNRKFRIEKVAFPEQNKPWKYQASPEDFEPIYCYIRPYQVQKIRFTEDPGFFIRFLDVEDKEIERKEYCPNEDALPFSSSGLNLSESDWN